VHNFFYLKNYGIAEHANWYIISHGPQLQHNLLFTDKTLHVVVQIASNAYKIASLRLTQHQQVVSSFSRCRRTRATRYIVLYTKVD